MENFEPNLNAEQLIFKQSEGGGPSSIPEVEDVLVELGLTEENDLAVFKYFQSKGGGPSSKPEVEDVYNLLNGNIRLWQESEEFHYGNGHGEYVSNVEEAVNFCKENKITDIVEIQKMIDNSLDDTTWREHAGDSGHGEYIDNVEKAAKFCKSKGANTKESVMAILKEAQTEKH